MASVQEADVDHFIPFSQYPRDLMQNFVLAHPSCSRSKPDTLGAKIHLERWREYSSRHTDDLAEIGIHAGRSANLQSSMAVTQGTMAMGTLVTHRLGSRLTNTLLFMPHIFNPEDPCCIFRLTTKVAIRT